MNVRDVVEEAVNRTDLRLRGFFKKEAHFIHFESGRSQTIENAVTILSKSTVYSPFPLVAMFTEGLVYKHDESFNYYSIPKIAIAVRTLINATENVKVKEVFGKILYPIRDELVRQLERLNFGYSMEYECYDFSGYTEKSGAVSLNQVCDAVILKNVKLKVKIKCHE